MTLWLRSPGQGATGSVLCDRPTWALEWEVSMVQFPALENMHSGGVGWGWADRATRWWVAVTDDSKCQSNVNGDSWWWLVGLCSRGRAPSRVSTSLMKGRDIPNGGNSGDKGREAGACREVVSGRVQ